MSTPSGSRDDRVGQGEVEAGKEKRLAKPILVYLFSADEKLKKKTKSIETVLLKNEKVALGCRLFNCVKANGDFLPPAFPYAELVKGKKLPRIVLIPRDLNTKKIKRFEAKISAKSLFSAMAKVNDKLAKVKLKKYVDGMRDVLNALDQLNEQEKKLSRDKKKGKSSKADEKKVSALRQRIKDAEAKLEKGGKKAK